MALKVGIPLYPGFDSLDVLGPYQTFTFAGMDRYLVAEQAGPVTSFEGVTIQAPWDFSSCPQLDVLFVPGGDDPITAVLIKERPGHGPYLDFLNGQAANATLVCSVCTGALLLGGAGLLKGHTATTHWAYRDALREFPGVHVVADYRRYVQSGNRVTGAGISSGLDVAMYIVSLLQGVQVARRGQLSMQYHPQPPFHNGDPDDTDIKDDPAMPDEIRQNWKIPEACIQLRNWLAGK